MANTNVTVLSGRLTKDIELRTTTSGKEVANGTLAVNGFNEEVSFIDVVFWGKTADVASKYTSKGSLLTVTGRLQQRTWEKDGQKRSIIEVVVSDLQLPPKADSTPMTQAQALNGGKDIALEDIDNSPIDLSEIPF